MPERLGHEQACLERVSASTEACPSADEARDVARLAPHDKRRKLARRMSRLGALTASHAHKNLRARDEVERAARSRSASGDKSRVIVAASVHAMLTKTWLCAFLAPDARWCSATGPAGDKG
jgi:hypothetical protein